MISAAFTVRMSATFSAKSTRLYASTHRCWLAANPVFVRAVCPAKDKAFTIGEIGCALNHSSHTFRRVGETRLATGGNTPTVPALAREETEWRVFRFML